MDWTNKFPPPREDVLYGNRICKVEMDSPGRYEGPYWAKTRGRAALLQEVPVPVREADNVGV